MTAITAPAMSTIPFGAVRAFVSIEARRALRNRRYVLFAVAFPVVFYLLYTGLVSGSSAGPDAQIAGISWRAYFMVSMATYAAIGAALGGSVVIAQERGSGWTRQLRVTPLPPAAYVTGKLIVSYVVTVPAVAAVMIAGLAVNGVAMPATDWLELLVFLAVGSLPFAALGLLIGYLFESDSAQGAMTITFFTLAILGGLWAPISSFPDGLATIGHMLPSFRLADLGRAAVAGVSPDPSDIAVLGLYAVAIGALVAWRYRSSASADGRR
jgi:ABC-2 type transport system permease protein